jgi:hypothetical protein
VASGPAAASGATGQVLLARVAAAGQGGFAAPGEGGFAAAWQSAFSAAWQAELATPGEFVRGRAGPGRIGRPGSSGLREVRWLRANAAWEVCLWALLSHASQS